MFYKPSIYILASLLNISDKLILIYNYCSVIIKDIREYKET